MNANIWRLAALISAALSVSACVFTPHEVNLQPQISLPTSTVGTGTSLYFQFVDDRADLNVGNRGVGGNGARISATQLPAVVENQLRQGLMKKGYQLAPSEAGANATASFRLRAFSLSLEMGFFSGGQNENVALAVDATKSGRTFTQIYRYSQEQRVQFAPTESEIDQLLNQALSDILRQALSDGRLDAFLTDKGAGA